jgi:hypothetical protein
MTGRIATPPTGASDLPFGLWMIVASRRSRGRRHSVAFVISAGLAWYVPTAMTLPGTAGRVVLPVGETARKANVPGERLVTPVELEWAEPGVEQGQ